MIDGSFSTLRLLASQALKTWNNDAVFKLLVENDYDDDYIVRTLAARELQIRGDKEIFNRLDGLESSSDDFVREICAFILGQFGTPNRPYKKQTIPILLKLITDSSTEVRATSAAALGHLCIDAMPPEVEKALYVAASDVDMEVRCSVALSLGSASTQKEAINSLNQLLEDTNKEVREYAKLGLEILEDK